MNNFIIKANNENSNKPNFKFHFYLHEFALIQFNEIEIYIFTWWGLDVVFPTKVVYWPWPFIFAVHQEVSHHSNPVIFIEFFIHLRCIYIHNKKSIKHNAQRLIFGSNNLLVITLPTFVSKIILFTTNVFKRSFFKYIINISYKNLCYLRKCKVEIFYYQTSFNRDFLAHR